MDFKKEKVFVALSCVFGAVCLAGIVFCATSLVSRSQTQAQIEKTRKSLQKLVNRGELPALSVENLEIEKANVRKLAVAKAKKIELLDSETFPQKISGATLDPSIFRSNLTENIEKRRAVLTADKIAIGDNAKQFGFSRYQSKNTDPAASALPLLSTEQDIVRVLLDSLVAARKKNETILRDAGVLQGDKRSFLYLKAIRREAGELPKKDGAPVAALASDELAVAEGAQSAQTGLFRLLSAENARTGVVFPSMRRANAVDAVVVQVSFVGTTAVLRDFVADFSPAADGRYKFPIYVRDISVVPATPADVETANRLLNPAPPAPAEEDAPVDFFGGMTTQEEPAGSVFGEAPAAPVVPEKSVVRPETLSEFTVTLEYAKPVKTSLVPAEDKAEEE